MKILFRITLVLITIASIGCKGDQESNPTTSIVDADGNIYTSVQIGNQTWMTENLRTTKYNDGTPIIEWSDSNVQGDWFRNNTGTPMYIWAANPDDSTEAPYNSYGCLYNEYALTSGKLIPDGWRMPTEADFKELINYISSDGHKNEEAVALKSKVGWMGEGNNGIDAYGFKALPTGVFYWTGNGIGRNTTFRTSGVNSEGTIDKSMILDYDLDSVIFLKVGGSSGPSVRCIKN